MRKKPTTKKLTKEKQMNTRDYIPVAKDEKFYRCYEYDSFDLYTSQYNQIIRLDEDGSTSILKSEFQKEKGYRRFRFNKNQYPNIASTKYLHKLVAETWCERLTWGDPSWEQQVHHLKKVIVKSKGKIKPQPIDINYADNLVFVYTKYHTLIDSIKNIKVSTYSGNWKSVKTIEDIAEYHGIPIAEVYELLAGEPTYIANDLEYYNINDSKSIEIRKIKKSKSKKNVIKLDAKKKKQAKEAKKQASKEEIKEEAKEVC